MKSTSTILFLLSINTCIFCQVTDFTVSYSPSGPYSVGDVITVNITATGTHTSNYNINIRMQSYNSGTNGCASNPSPVQILAGTTTGIGTFTVPATYANNQGTATGCSGSPLGSGTFLRAFLTANNAGNPTAISKINSVVLPIEIKSFTGKSNDKSVQLEWETLSETDNHYFEVQRSNNGEIFKAIGKIEGAGNSSVIRAYQYVDDAPDHGINYYRLKQTDFDGTYAFSEVIMLESRSTAQSLSIYPTAVTQGESFTVSLPNGGISAKKLEVFDLSGRMMQGEDIPQNQTYHFLPTDILSKGIYIVRLTESSDKVSTAKVQVH